MTHGASAYSHGDCRCEVCTAAHRAYRIAQRAVERPYWVIKHGARAYTNGYCRCIACTLAHRFESRAYRQRRKKATEAATFGPDVLST